MHGALCLNPSTEKKYILVVYLHNEAFFSKKKEKTARCCWLMPVILATQEAEIRRISAQSQPR
jgi:hypothetical protein